jgi:gamma-glutamylcyclotransferase (GGCT)/AIG2-like uncharacterized protein YtfP
MKHGNIFNSEETKLVAVYGTLRTGHGNNGVMGSSKLIGLGKTVELFTLTDYCGGGFPALDKSVPTHNVTMEVFEVLNQQDASRIDQLEGYGHGFYDRSIVEVQLDDGTVVEAWTYDIEGATSSCPTVESGDWDEYQSTRRQRRYG